MLAVADKDQLDIQACCRQRAMASTCTFLGFVEMFERADGDQFP